MKAFDATYGLPLGAADAADPDAIAGEVLGVGRVHLFGADLFLRSADATRGFDTGYGRL
jgi:hypothetical protein